MLEYIRKEIIEYLEYLDIDMSNIDLMAFTREEKQNKEHRMKMALL
jgi:hypothetical protein